MQQERRKTLSIRPASDAVPGGVGDAATLVSQAVQLRVCLSATYNRAAFTLAPHILYTRHGEPFTDAMVIACDGKPPREPKLGTFKLSGLSGVALTGVQFEPQPLFDPTDVKYAEHVIRMIKA